MSLNPRIDAPQKKVKLWNKSQLGGKTKGKIKSHAEKESETSLCETAEMQLSLGWGDPKDDSKKGVGNVVIAWGTIQGL